LFDPGILVFLWQVFFGRRIEALGLLTYHGSRLLRATGAIPTVQPFARRHAVGTYRFGYRSRLSDGTRKFTASSQFRDPWPYRSNLAVVPSSRGLRHHETIWWAAQVKASTCDSIGRRHTPCHRSSSPRRSILCRWSQPCTPRWESS